MASYNFTFTGTFHGLPDGVTLNPTSVTWNAVAAAPGPAPSPSPAPAPSPTPAPAPSPVPPGTKTSGLTGWLSPTNFSTELGSWAYGSTFVMANDVGLPRAATKVRIVLGNANMTPTPVASCVVAGVGDYNQALSPSAYINATVGGNASFTMPTAVNAGQANHFIPGITITDSVTLATAADVIRVMRPVAGNERFLFRRGTEILEFATDSRNSNSMSMWTGINQVQPGYDIKASAPSLTRNNATFFVLAVIPDYGVETVDMLVVGDSVDAHEYPVTGDVGMSQAAMFESFLAGGKKLTVLNLAQDGQNHASSRAIAKALLDQGLRPTFQSMATWSTNSGTEQAAFDTIWTGILASVAHAKALGVKTLLRAVQPQGNSPATTNPTINARVTAQNNKAKALAASDPWVVVADVANGWVPSTMSFDTNHTTVAGTNYGADILRLTALA